MILAIGTDIIAVERIAKAMQNKKFIDRILTQNEKKRALTPEYVAGRWAAKEALKKALPEIETWHCVEIITNPTGKPIVVINNQLLLNFNLNLHVSITHEKKFALAFAIIEKVS